MCRIWQVSRSVSALKLQSTSSHCIRIRINPRGLYRRNILTKGGKAVDAAIAALICEGVVNPQSSGIGGGFTMIIYKTADEKAHTINAMAHAPENFSQSMNGNDQGGALKGESIYHAREFYR